MLLRLLPLMLREQPLLWLQRQMLLTLPQQVPGWQPGRGQGSLYLLVQVLLPVPWVLPFG
jgi:hypothetical protein